MTVVDDGVGAGGLIARVKNILLTPKTEWERIDAEPTSIRGLYLGYICILAAIPVVASAIGSLAFGHGVPGIAFWRPSPGFVLVGALINYLLALVGVAVIAFVIDALAPSFGGTKNRTQAFKVAAYSYTAAWVAGVFGIIPWLALIGLLLGLYSFYLLYLGLPRLMKAPDDKAVGYTVVTVVVSLVVYVVIGAIVAALTAATVAMTGLGPARTAVADGGTVTIGGRTIDVGKMQRAAEQMEAAGRGEKGPVEAVPADTLKAMLPASLGGLAQSEVSTGSAGAAGFGASNAEARYARDDSRIRLSVTDMAAAGAIATLGGMFGAQSSRETETGYERMSVVGGRMTTEKYDRQSRSGSYMIVVGERFMIEAEGDQVEMSQLKAAVNAVDAGRLERLARG